MQLQWPWSSGVHNSVNISLKHFLKMVTVVEMQNMLETILLIMEKFLAAIPYSYV
jgi:hypothetical protein